MKQTTLDEEKEMVTKEGNTMKSNFGFRLFYRQGSPYLVFSIGDNVYIRRTYNIHSITCTADIKFKKKLYRVRFYK